MKKSIIIIFLFILGTSNILIKSKNTKVTYNKNEIISASYVIPENLEELDENAPIILKGSFTGNRKIDEDTNIVGPSTISEFKVDKVYKGSIENDIISVLEPFEIKDNNFTNIEGYIPMEENKEYILFLRENDISEGKQYTIKFISFGKYNTSKEDNIVNQKSNIKNLEEVKDSEFISESQEICDTYINIKGEVLDKYLYK